MIVCGLIEWKLTSSGFVLLVIYTLPMRFNYHEGRLVNTLNVVPFEFWMFKFSSQTVATCTTSGTVECLAKTKIYHSMYVMSPDLY